MTYVQQRGSGSTAAASHGTRHARGHSNRQTAAPQHTNQSSHVPMELGTAQASRRAPFKSRNNYVNVPSRPGSRAATSRFTGTCNYCGKVGHKESDCWAKHGRPNVRGSAATMQAADSAQSWLAPAAASSLPAPPQGN